MASGCPNFWFLRIFHIFMSLSIHGQNFMLLSSQSPSHSKLNLIHMTIYVTPYFARSLVYKLTVSNFIFEIPPIWMGDRNFIFEPRARVLRVSLQPMPGFIPLLPMTLFGDTDKRTQTDTLLSKALA